MDTVLLFGGGSGGHSIVIGLGGSGGHSFVIW